MSKNLFSLATLTTTCVAVLTVHRLTGRGPITTAACALVGIVAIYSAVKTLVKLWKERKKK